MGLHGRLKTVGWPRVTVRSACSLGCRNQFFKLPLSELPPTADRDGPARPPSLPTLGAGPGPPSGSPPEIFAEIFPKNILGRIPGWAKTFKIPIGILTFWLGRISGWAFSIQIFSKTDGLSPTLRPYPGPAPSGFRPIGRRPPPRSAAVPPAPQCQCASGHRGDIGGRDSTLGAGCL